MKFQFLIGNLIMIEGWARDGLTDEFQFLIGNLIIRQNLSATGDLY